MNDSNSWNYAMLALLSELVGTLVRSAEQAGVKEVKLDIQSLYLVQLMLNEAANSFSLD